MKQLLVFISIFIFNSSYAQVSDFKSIDFTRADIIAKLNEGSSLKNPALLAHNLTYKLNTDVEKFRAIYTWVCTNIIGDNNQHSKVDRFQKKFKNDSLQYINWNNQYKKMAFKKLLKHKKTMCTGYAYLIKELCFLVNIECEIIDGYGRTVTSNIDELEMLNHSWNAVKLNNKWYLCDATWSSGYMDGKNTFIKDYNKGYFLTDPVLFAKNHFPLHKKWLLNDAITESKFIDSPIVYGETFKHKIIPISPKEMNVTINKNEEISFSFKTLKTVNNDEVSLILFSGINELPFKIYGINNKNGLVTFKTKFQYKGYYDVHLKINKDVVATYTIQVKKG